MCIRDRYNIGVQFKAAATVRITYALMSRGGLEPERYFDHEDFMAIFDFNTPSTIGAVSYTHLVRTGIWRVTVGVSAGA